ncbi:MAG: hypothetical protein G01um101418_198 [Parcubacteria group bacterium Gr01-1014_18]|nr:MAG: hypothetical protein Greene041636_166 [Parcubacteria group bacterium Greene0416_36]TSC81358.1 MAG: hypothetical protein G01um101418_198 [Parcubacteria group bacterium Gr01-1014_18]TSC99456.1 MAG: hypothetical protein Greene101420_123 [Parcubacteria group bacterium Greene1014_20]TSD07625.1 MAG: hypothetical protein Greene07142_82 [Parcubacteria group bacterium Greene0714_2]
MKILTIIVFLICSVSIFGAYCGKNLVPRRVKAVKPVLVEIDFNDCFWETGKYECLRADGSISDTNIQFEIVKVAGGGEIRFSIDDSSIELTQAQLKHKSAPRLGFKIEKENGVFIARVPKIVIEQGYFFDGLVIGNRNGGGHKWIVPYQIIRKNRK